MVMMIVKPHVGKLHRRRLIRILRDPHSLTLRQGLRSALLRTRCLLSFRDVGILRLASGRGAKDFGEDETEQGADGWHACAEDADWDFDCAPVADFNVVLCFCQLSDAAPEDGEHSRVTLLVVA